MSIKPRTRCPDLALPTLDGDRFDLAKRKPQAFSMLVFYRGLHCPICKKSLRELDGKLAEFEKRGVDVVAISMDTAERAAQSKKEWGLERLALAHDLSADQAREWGLYLSKAIKDAEPALFSEPGVFLVRPDATLYCASIQSMPFARPSFDDLLGAVDFVNDKDYPARGEA